MNNGKVIILWSFLLFNQTVKTVDEADKDQSKRFFNTSYILNSIISSPILLLKQAIKYQYPVCKPDGAVKVQKTTDLCPQEKLFLKNRLHKVQTVLKDEFGIDKPLRLAFCCSGGGNRAMIGSLGFLTGAVKSKIFDACLYVAGLSGSTWTIAPLTYLGARCCENKNALDILTDMKNSLDISLSKDAYFCAQGIYSPPLLPLSLTDNFFIDVSKRFAYDQPLTLINIFGSLVSSYSLKLLGHNCLDATWSSIAQSLQSGHMPLPLCASIFETSPRHYDWFEMSPFQAGSEILGYIPVQYLGSDFCKGELSSSNHRPEYPISFYLGMYGSAFAATVQDINEEQIKLRGSHTFAENLFEVNSDELELRGNKGIMNFLYSNQFVQNYMKDLTQQVLADRKPITYAQFPNFSNENSSLGLFDAGIDFNIPVPTLIDRPERDLDLIIIYDSNQGDLQTIREIAAYGKRKGLALPDAFCTITYDQLSGHDMTVFNDPRTESYNKNIATYLYFPTRDIDVTVAPYITFNFKYLPEEIEFLADKTEQAFLSQIQEIKQIMQLVSCERHA
ncbi:MAG: hypothetical protein NTZ68_03935 [Candidatus Dependentiae bacterium]|nr:hypothetical protein [Candidatus Dependentiae bacterium]